MKISDRRLTISDSLKISYFSNSLGVLQQYSSNTPIGKVMASVSGRDLILSDLSNTDKNVKEKNKQGTIIQRIYAKRVYISRSFAMANTSIMIRQI